MWWPRLGEYHDELRPVQVYCDRWRCQICAKSEAVGNGVQAQGDDAGWNNFYMPPWDAPPTDIFIHGQEVRFSWSWCRSGASPFDRHPPPACSCSLNHPGAPCCQSGRATPALFPPTVIVEPNCHHRRPSTPGCLLIRLDIVWKLMCNHQTGLKLPTVSHPPPPCTSNWTISQRASRRHSNR